MKHDSERTPEEMLEVSGSRLRLAVRCLIGAAEADKTLITDDSWQRVLSSVTELVNRNMEERRLAPMRNLSEVALLPGKKQ